MTAAKSTKKTKDLPARNSGAVKGGRLGANENLTLIRAAKPKAS
jgi:hypothetical protein